MNMQAIFDHFNTHQEIPVDDVTWMIANKLEVYNALQVRTNRNFAIRLLASLVDLRKTYMHDIGIQDIAFGCLMVALHRQIGDCLLVWKAKNTDFDTYCGVDIELVPFMGLPATIAYLKTNTDPDAAKALTYIAGCDEEEDFGDLDRYYAHNDQHWFMTM
ncbi:hypothetical protein [Chitinophaga arvensicola]|uniref:Uncharacterized protein n=1 Tax=Chitinophaga arvensicola TaxID=29529 RepID=A0A1I0RV16_9BACT|nr:hypothetical protein [Chitinophaga arvensicola]SEW45127.1 hypothetical protein SAMN04488122_3420 [Chitinophaga arvensicola]